MSAEGKPRRGFVLGKFMPPHEGHVFLCRFAQNSVEELTILVCSLSDDPIPGALRFQWMQELFPTARVLWCEENLPQAPEDDVAHFWPIWREVVRRYHPQPIDVVFASEDYGHRLAQEVGARFVPCDPARSVAPVSGSAIRENPYAHWSSIPANVRPYFVKRVCLFGPESSGKTTLATALAARFGTIVAAEYGRIYTEQFGLELELNDLVRIGQGQHALTDAAKPRANRVLVEDTDPLLTAVWSDMLLGRRDPWFAAFDDYADLYLLCGVDFPWEDDGTRYFPDPADRKRFYAACEAELDARGVMFTTVDGPHYARLALGISAVENLLGVSMIPPRT